MEHVCADLGAPPHHCNQRLVRKTYFSSNLYIKTIFLPRQARDKHRKSLKRVRFSQEAVGYLCDMRRRGYLRSKRKKKTQRRNLPRVHCSGHASKRKLPGLTHTGSGDAHDKTIKRTLSVCVCVCVLQGRHGRCIFLVSSLFSC